MKLYNYRIRGNSITGLKGEKFYRDTLAINREIADVAENISGSLAGEMKAYIAKTAFLYLADIYKEDKYEEIKLILSEDLKENYKYVRCATFMQWYYKPAIYIAGYLAKYNNYILIRLSGFLKRMINR